MRYALRATEARGNYSRVLEDAARVRPQVIRRLRDTIYWISADHLESMLAPCRLTLHITREEDGSYCGVFDELDIMDAGNDVAELKDNLAAALRDYAEAYMEEFPLYYNSPNRRRHLPYVWRILMQTDVAGVVGLFDAVMD